MTLIDFLRNAGFGNRERIYVNPNIPRELLINALTAYEIGVAHKDVAVLVDDTIMGSGKDGCLILGNGILFRESFGNPNFYNFDVLKSFRVERKKIFLGNRALISFIFPGDRDILDLFSLVSEWIKLRASNAESIAKTSNGTPESDDIPDGVLRDVATEVAAFARKSRIERVYVQPDIPTKKLTGALSALEGDISPRGVLILIDDTVFGGAKEGMLLTANVISIKSILMPPLVVPLKHIGTISLKGRTLFINNEERTFSQLGEKELGPLIMFLNYQLHNARDARSSFLKTGSQDAHAPAMPAPEHDLKQERSIVLASKTTEIESSSDSTGESKTELAKKGIADQIFNWAGNNRGPIIKLLREKVGDLSASALRDDENMKSVATFLYGLLPIVIKLVLKEHVFVQFVLDNRNKIIDKLDLISPAELMLTGDRPLVASLPFVLDTSDEDVSYRNPQRSINPIGISEGPLNEDSKIAFKNIIAVQDQLKDLLDDDPDMNIHIKLGYNILIDTTSSFIKIADGTTEDIEIQILMYFSIAYGASFHTVANSIKELDKALEIFLIGLFAVLSTYVELFDKDESEILGTFIGYAAICAKLPSRNKLETKMHEFGLFDKHNHRAFKETLLNLLDRSSEWAAHWSNFLLGQNDHMRWRLWNKWSEAIPIDD